MKQRIAHFRKAKGLTQQQLANEVGITLSMVGKLERDERALSFDMAVKIAAALDLIPMELIDFEDDVSVSGFLSERGRIVFEDAELEILEGTLTTADFELPEPLGKCEINVQSPISLAIPIGSWIGTRLRQAPSESEYVGKLSIVAISGERDPVLAIVLKGTEPGLYHLALVGGPPLQDQKISWACPMDEIRFD